MVSGTGGFSFFQSSTERRVPNGPGTKDRRVERSNGNLSTLSSHLGKWGTAVPKEAVLRELSHHAVYIPLPVCRAAGYKYYSWPRLVEFPSTMTNWILLCVGAARLGGVACWKEPFSKPDRNLSLFPSPKRLTVGSQPWENSHSASTSHLENGDGQWYSLDLICVLKTVDAFARRWAPKNWSQGPGRWFHGWKSLLWKPEEQSSDPWNSQKKRQIWWCVPVAQGLLPWGRK